MVGVRELLGALDVDHRQHLAVAQQRDVCRFPSLCDETPQERLGARADVDMGDRSAPKLEQPHAQAVLAVQRMLADHPLLFEHHQKPVQRALVQR